MSEGRTITDILEAKFPGAEFLLSFDQYQNLNVDYYYWTDITQELRAFFAGGEFSGPVQKVKVHRRGTIQAFGKRKKELQ